MLSLPGPVKIFLYAEPADLRKSYDSLSALVREHLERNVLDGGLFVFLNQRCNRIKLLYWDRDGLAIWQKQFESECPPFFLFTEFGRPADNCARWPVTAGGMDSRSTRFGPRRRPMPREIGIIAPPRAPGIAGPWISAGCGTA